MQGKMRVSKNEFEANRIMQNENNHDRKPKRKRLVFWNGTVDTIEQLLVLVLDCLSSDVTLGGGARKIAALDDDDVFGGSDALVDIAARVKLPRSPDDLLLELLKSMVHPSEASTNRCRG
jgi:hypothetical protein